MDPHDISTSDVRVGKLPEEVYDWMKPAENESKDNAIKSNN